jgi:hypothetical protein
MFIYLETFMKKATNIHGDIYVYEDLPNKIDLGKKINVTCPKHGKFAVCVRTHLSKRKSCNGCPHRECMEARGFYSSAHPPPPDQL